MENTAKTETGNVLDDLQKLPAKAWNEFKKFGLLKKGVIIGLIYFIISDLTKSLNLNKADLMENLVELPKKVWANFWTAPTGKKFMLVLASWYVVNQLFPKDEAAKA